MGRRRGDGGGRKRSVRRGRGGYVIWRLNKMLKTVCGRTERGKQHHDDDEYVANEV